jgi:hypothetical protein
LPPLHGSSAYFGSGRQAVEVVALRAEVFGEIPGVTLLVEPVVDDRSAGGLPMLETVRGSVDAGLLEGDLLVEPGDGGRDVGFPTFLRLEFLVRPHPGFSSSYVTVPPAGAMVGGLLSLWACLAGLGEISNGPTGLAVLPDTGAGFQVGACLPGLRQGRFGLAQGGRPIR